ncbi:MAG TPA: hypothetical protein VLV83_07430 [Acidobacteriota bacterium]|nr:hypothetical protein [Acidobacteriota bacterium]
MAVEFLAVVAFVTLAYAMISRKAESRPLTPPMFFVLAGLALSPAGLAFRPHFPPLRRFPARALTPELKLD